MVKTAVYIINPDDETRQNIVFEKPVAVPFCSNHFLIEADPGYFLTNGSVTTNRVITTEPFAWEETEEELTDAEAMKIIMGGA